MCFFNLTFFVVTLHNIYPSTSDIFNKIDMFPL